MRKLFGAVCMCTSLWWSGTAVASSCQYEAAIYGTFTLGSWGDANSSVGGDVIGSSGMVRSNAQWDFDRDNYMGQCQHFAGFNASVAASRWPDDATEARAFFARAKRECRDYFHMVHRKFSGQLCE